jgi:general secretion pathway protein D
VNTDPFDSPYARLRRLLGLALQIGLCLALCACAGQEAFLEGKRLLSQDKVEEGLASLKRAMSEDPGSTEYKTAFAMGRERATATWLKQADTALQNDRTAEASALYQRVLEVQTGNSMARQGLRGVERKIRLGNMLADAKRSLQAGEKDQAKATLDALLRADPNHAEALTLLKEANKKAPPTALESALADAYRKPISMDFKEATLRQVFDVLARTSGLNFVFDKDVKTDQKTSIILRDSTVESALYFLLLTNQLEQQVMNENTLLIYPNVATKVKDYQELSVRTFQMIYADVKSVAAALKTLLKGRDIVADEKLNMLVARDTPSALRMIEKMVALHDLPEPEVMLEVEILEVTRSKLRDLGVTWPDSLSLAPLATDNSIGLTLDDLRNLDAGRVSATIGSVAINLKNTETDVNVLANPRIRVVNREKAKVLIGDRIPLITVTTSPTGGYAEAINYTDVGLKLEVEPVIYRSNDVVIKVGLEVSNISGTTTSKLGGVSYTFGTRTANTVLRLHDGENQVLAGLINDEDRRTARKVPGLGDMPMVGRLFGSSLDDGKKNEIVLSITPRLVRNVYRPEGEPVEFNSGTESSTRERPASVSQPRQAPSMQSATAPAMKPAPTAPVSEQVPTAASAPVTPASSVKQTPTPTPKAAPARAPERVAALLSPALTLQLVDEGRNAP